MDFVIWLLFRRTASHKPSHLLCHGFKRAGAHTVPCIPGLVSTHANSYVETLKGPVWCRLHALLGQGGDRIMMDLLLTCGIFYRFDGRPGNFYQLSGLLDRDPGAYYIDERRYTYNRCEAQSCICRLGRSTGCRKRAKSQNSIKE